LALLQTNKKNDTNAQLFINEDGKIIGGKLSPNQNLRPDQQGPGKTESIRVRPGYWHVVTIVVNCGKLKIYIDGHKAIFEQQQPQQYYQRFSAQNEHFAINDNITLLASNDRSHMQGACLKHVDFKTQILKTDDVQLLASKIRPDNYPWPCFYCDKKEGNSPHDTTCQQCNLPRMPRRDKNKVQTECRRCGSEIDNPTECSSCGEPLINRRQFRKKFGGRGGRGPPRFAPYV
jgi:hypothetical protein